MNGFDLSTISGAYIGSNPISAIYLGSNKIWPNIVPHEDEYLTFEAIDNIKIALESSIVGYHTLEYSLDNGSTWQTLTCTAAAHSSSYATFTPTINAGSKIMWKRTLALSSHPLPFNFYSSGRFNVYGNVMSLFFGDNFLGEKDLSGADPRALGLFDALFKRCPIINAEDLILPATILSSACYAFMFVDCTSLTTVPELPSTTLAGSCYQGMFSGCTSLTTAPELHATTLMSACYMEMFSGCTSLTTAPELPATTLVDSCYNVMFSRCTNLNYIKMMATDISAQQCLENWTYGVSSTGTFVKNAAMTTLPTGTSGIPAGWTVQDA